MATETIGGVEFTVDMDTSGAINSIKVVDGKTKEIIKTFDGLGAKVKKSTKAVKTGLAGMGRSAGQAGIQFQQFIGQVQGGQSAMLALSQQSADLGFVLGAPLLGAVVGISASLVSLLIPSLFDSGESVDKLIEKMNEWKKTIGLTREQANFLIQEEVKASTARAKSISDYTEQIRIVKIAIKNQEQALLVDRKNEKTKKNLAEANRKSLIELDKLTALRQSETQAIVESNKKIEVYNSSVGEGTNKTKEQKEALDSLRVTLGSQLISLEQQARALKDGEESAFRWATAQRLGMKEGELFEESVDRRIASIFKLKRAQEDAAEAKRQSDKQDAANKSLSGQVQTLGLSATDQVQARLNSELELLRQAQEQKIEIEGTYEERRVELRRQAEERIKSINEKATKDSAINFEALENQVIGTFASVASGAQDGKEAVRSLAQSIATQLIGSLIKLGIQSVIGQTTAAATGVATASTLSAAYAAPAAFASLASFGANAVPAQAGIASTVGLSTALAGGRESGGPVTKGRLYEVGEKNKPEMLQSGGKQYMIPGNNGNVISNKEMNGGGGVNVNVSVNNLPGQNATVTGNGVTEQMVIQITNDAIKNQSASLGSDLNRNINKNHNVTNRQSGNRRN